VVAGGAIASAGGAAVVDGAVVAAIAVSTHYVDLLKKLV